MVSLDWGEAVGVVLVATGFLALYNRAVADTFQLNELFVTGIGLLAVVLGVNYFNEGRNETRRSTPVEDVEPRFEVPVPGDETDETLSRVSGFSRSNIRNRREFHETLREVAVETLAARGDYGSDEAAVEAIRTGTWTDDETAAWFLGEDLSPPLSVRVRAWLGADGEFIFGAKRTIAALVSARDLELDETDDERGGDEAGDERDDETERDETSGRGPGAAVPGTAGGGTTDAGGASDGTGDRTATGSEASDRWRLTEGRE